MPSPTSSVPTVIEDTEWTDDLDSAAVTRGRSTCVNAPAASSSSASGSSLPSASTTLSKESSKESSPNKSTPSITSSSAPARSSPLTTSQTFSPSSSSNAGDKRVSLISSSSTGALVPPSPSTTKLQQKRITKSRKAQELFGWPSNEILIKDFSCAIEKGIMLHGRMYVSEKFVAFYTSLFSGVKLCIPVSDINNVKEANQALVFPNAIKLFVTPVDAAAKASLPAASAATAPTESSYFFGSFKPGNRSKAHQLISSLINHTYDKAQWLGECVNLNLDDDKWRGSVSTSSNASEHGSGNDSSHSRNNSSSALTIEEEGEDIEIEGEGEGESQSTNSGVGAEADDIIQHIIDGGEPAIERERRATHLDFAEHRTTMQKPAAGDGAFQYEPMLKEEFSDLSAKAFWRCFMSDAPLYSPDTYHKTRGDTEFAISIWKDAKLVDGASVGGYEFIRDTMVRVPVIGSPMGPDSTRVLKVQKYKIEANPAGPGDQITMSTIAITPDVPFGDCFHLQDEWLLTDNASGGCTLSIKLGINIHKMNWKLRAIKSMLISRATGDNQKGFILYVGEMKKYLQDHKAEVDALKKNIIGAVDAKPVIPSTPTAKTKKVAPLPSPNAKSATSPTTSTSSPPASTSAPTPATSLPPTSVSSGSFTTSPSSSSPSLDSYLKQLPPPLQTLPALAGVLLFVWLLLTVVFGSHTASSFVSILTCLIVAMSTQKMDQLESEIKLLKEQIKSKKE